MPAIWQAERSRDGRLDWRVHADLPEEHLESTSPVPFLRCW